jgi:oligosaccharide repeat unit polymerase
VDWPTSGCSSELSARSNLGRGRSWFIKRVAVAISILTVASLLVAVAIVVNGSPLSIWTTLSAIALMAVGAGVSWILYGTLASPLGLFSLAWEGGLILTGLQLVRYVQPSPKGLLMLQASYISVVAASALVGRSLDRPKSFEARRAIGPALLVLGTLGVVLTLTQLAAKYGLFAIFFNGPEVRQGIVSGTFDKGIPAYLGLLLFPAAAMIPPRVVWVGAILAVAAVFSLLSSNRSYLFLVVAFLAVGLLFSPRRSFASRHVAIAAALLILCGLVFIVGGALLGKQQLINSQIEVSGSSTVLPPVTVASYVYATGGFVEFEKYVDDVSPGTEGLYAVITPLVRLTGHKETAIYEFRPIPFPFNLYTYLRSWYDGFGYVGIVVGPALYAALAAVAFRRRITSLAWYGVACVTTVGLLAGVWTPYLAQIAFQFLLVLMIVLPVSLRIGASRIGWLRRYLQPSDADAA